MNKQDILKIKVLRAMKTNSVVVVELNERHTKTEIVYGGPKIVLHHLYQIRIGPYFAYYSIPTSEEAKLLKNPKKFIKENDKFITSQGWQHD